MEKFPGIDNIKDDRVYRSITRSETSEPLACGFMNKSGIEQDPYDWRVEKYSLVYVLKGNGFLLDEDNKHYPVVAGDYYQRLPQSKHQVIVNAESSWKECYMSVSCKMYSLFTEIGTIKPSPNICHIGIDNTLISKVWNLKENLKYTGELELPFTLLEIVKLITQFHIYHGKLPETIAKSQLINSACNFLSNNFHNNSDPKEFCKTAGIGYESFRKIFQKHMGISPGKYRIKKRLEKACQMLSNQNMSLGDLAEELGFSSQFEFSNHFKKHIGVPPSRYLK